jgi:hypothetical protein
MNITIPNPFVRTGVAALVAGAIFSLSALAIHAPARTQTSVTFKSIRTDRAETLYAGYRPDCAWFREAVVPTGQKLADHRPDCAWFREGVLPTDDSKLMSDRLQSVAATL